jgi:hypothetical protein
MVRAVGLDNAAAVLIGQKDNEITIQPLKIPHSFSL